MNKLISLKRRAAASLAAAALLITVPLAGCSKTNDDGSGRNESAVSEVKTKFGDGIAVKSDNYKVSYNVMEYLMNYMVQEYYGSYGSSDFDLSKDLKKQYYDEENKITWYDYFYDQTINYVTRIMVFAEGGKAEGLKLSDEELEQLNQSFEQIESIAAESSMTLEEFIANEYGGKVTKEEVEEIQKMTVLARDYNNYVIDSFKYTDEDYEKQYEENKNEYIVSDYLIYSFAYSENESSGSVKKEVAKENADALANAKNQDEFEEYLEKYLRDNPLNVSLPTSSESSVTEEDFNAGIVAAIDAANNEKVPYNDSNECYRWIFSEDRKENDIVVIDENSAYNVILVTKPSYRDESPTRNIRHILVQFGTEDDADAKAKESADKIYQEWKSGDKTEETFAQLANKYSEDPGSNTNGGLYENVTEGYMVEAFNDWMFDSSRKVGDSAIVKTEIGYHIMYYPGPGLTAWQVNVDNDLRQKDIGEEYEKMKDKYKVEFDEDALKEIVIKTSESSTGSAAESE